LGWRGSKGWQLHCTCAARQTSIGRKHWKHWKHWKYGKHWKHWKDCTCAARQTSIGIIVHIGFCALRFVTARTCAHAGMHTHIYTCASQTFAHTHTHTNLHIGLSETACRAAGFGTAFGATGHQRTGTHTYCATQKESCTVHAQRPYVPLFL